MRRYLGASLVLLGCSLLALDGTRWDEVVATFPGRKHGPHASEVIGFGLAVLGVAAALDFAEVGKPLLVWGHSVTDYVHATCIQESQRPLARTPAAEKVSRVPRRPTSPTGDKQCEDGLAGAPTWPGGETGVRCGPSHQPKGEEVTEPVPPTPTPEPTPPPDPDPLPPPQPPDPAPQA